MTKLDYFTQLSFEPITLSIGRIKKPTIREISKLTFDKFSFFEFLVKMTPEDYYTKLMEKNGGIDKWEEMSFESQNKLSIYDCIIADKQLQDMYIELLNFFFIEPVIYAEGFFIILKEGCENINVENLNEENICGLLARENLSEVFCLIQQICGIYSEEDDVENLKFKNDFQKQWYMNMLKAKKEYQKNVTKKADSNMSLPNIISKVATLSPGVNFVTIQDYTLFQVIDSFGTLQNDKMFDINKTRVSVWGDEKKAFEFSLWYKNNYDNKKK